MNLNRALQLLCGGTISLLVVTPVALAENIISCTSSSIRVQQDQHEKGGIPSRQVEAQISFDDNSDSLGNVPSIMFQGPDGRHPVIYKKSAVQPTMLQFDEESPFSSWHGEMDGTQTGSATIIESADGNGFAGTFSVDGAVYQMNTMPDGTVTMNVVSYQDFPDEEHDDQEEENPESGFAPVGPPTDGWITNTNNTADDHHPHRSLSQVLNNKMLRGNLKPSEKKQDPQGRSLQTKADITNALKKKASEKMKEDPEDNHHGRKLQSAGAAVVDVLVVYTQRSMCAEAGLSSTCSSSNNGPIENLITLAEEETNFAYQESGMSTRIRVVAKHLDTSGFDEFLGDFAYALNSLRFTGDGRLEYVQGMRDAVGADLVTMIINQSGSCGRGNINGPYAVTARRCATGYYSFGHELGHNFGCHHDRSNANPQLFAHGWQDPGGRFRSIMAYTCPNGGCPRVQRFSNPHTTYIGSAIGDPDNDCARRIDERGPIVASWKSEPSSGGGGSGGCSDEPSGWHDVDGEFYDCGWYAVGNRCSSYGDSYANNGVTANMACCACGGGSAGTSSGGGGSSCSSTPEGWYDADGPTYNCAWYGQGSSRCQNYGNSFENFGKTANEACCECGGGSTGDQ